MKITSIGGPTALIEIDGFRLLTDPAFDPAGSEFTNGPSTLYKTAGPTMTPEQIDPVDAVLLSHDQHYDNFDRSGREFSLRAPRLVTTPSGAKRLGGAAVGLSPWESTKLATKNSSASLTITSAPARHGPPGIEPMSGAVTGFIVQPGNEREPTVYITGDTVWYEGVADVAQRFDVTAIVLFAGAARVPSRTPEHLTMNVEDAIATARAFPKARIFPVHHHGWKHFSENLQSLVDGFVKAGLSDRLQPMMPGDSADLIFQA
jgi:L-ascorbate metabolism protein UlaG (beta-lactamase superfamily)